ncbi:MAG: peroxiredoxin [Nocardioidaceae bacterium]
MKTLTEGSTAPDFELPDQNGRPVSLSGLLANGPVVLFFYPVADSPGCTREACHFRDLAAEFAETGAQRIGISRDTVEKQQAFDTHHGLGYPVLSDADGAVADAYGVKRGLLGALVPVKRTTFVVDRDQVVRAVIASETNMSVHADKALSTLHSL